MSISDGKGKRIGRREPVRDTASGYGEDYLPDDIEDAEVIDEEGPSYYDEGSWQPTPRANKRPRPTHDHPQRQRPQYEDDYEEEYDDYEDVPPRSRSRQRRRPQRGRRAPERVEWESHPVWQGMIGWYFKWFGLATIWTAFMVLLYQTSVFDKVYWVVLSTFIVYGAVFGISRLIRRATTYRITNRAVYETSGIFHTTSEHARLEEITNTRVTRSMTDRLLGVGTINFSTAGEVEGQDLLIWESVRNPYALQQLVDRLRDGEEDWEPAPHHEGDEGF